MRIADALHAIARSNAALNAVLHVDALVRGGSGSLGNWPVLVKDCMAVQGMPTSNGSAIAAPAVSSVDAEVVRRLRGAGAALIGKSHLTEFCFGATGENAHFGDCRNPWDLDRIPGGSSSGSAVAVAAGLVRLAIGTDTGGSIRVPAALCGVVGLRPTFGRVSNRGVLDVSLTCDTVGPIAATIREAAAAFTVMAGFDPADPMSLAFPGDSIAGIDDGMAGARIGLPRPFFFDGLEPDVAAKVEMAALACEARGATLVDVPLADAAGLAEHRAFQFVLADVADARRAELRDHADRLGPEVRRRIELGQRVSGIDYAACVRALWRWKRELRQIFAGEIDILLTPTTPVTAPLWSDSRDMVAATRLVARNTYDIGAAGVPSLTLPCGLDHRGLPIGVQLTAAWGEEATLFRIGAALEQALAFTALPAIHSNNSLAPPRR